MKHSVVVFDDIPQSREPTVMIEPAIRVAPESGKWSCTVHVCRRAVRLEGIHTDLARSMKVVPRLREKRRHMAAGTFALAIENFFAALCCALVKAPSGGLRRRDSQLVEMKRGQLRGHFVWHAPRVPRSAVRSNRILLGIVEPGIVERAGAVHFRCSNVRMPVGDGAKSCPSVEAEARQPPRGRDQSAGPLAVRAKSLSVFI